MNILFLTDNFPPEVNAPATRTFEHAKVWVALGHKVTIITCAPNYPEGKVYAGYQNKWFQRENIDGINVLRVKTFMSPNSGTLKRILDYLSFMVSSFICGIFVRKPDVIIGTSPQFFTVVSAWMLSVIKQRPFVFELRDIWPASFNAVGVRVNPFILYLLTKLEIFLYHRASLIVAVTDSFRNELVRRGVNSRKITVVKNGVSLGQALPYNSGSVKPEWILEKYNLRGKFVVGYIGTLGLAHNLSCVVAAAKNLVKTEDIVIMLVGAGAQKLALQDEVKKLQIENVMFVDKQPRSVILDFWSVCDISLLSLANSKVFQSVIPSKMFEAMASGCPIVAAIPAGEATEIISKNKVGLCVAPNDPAQLSDCILDLYNRKSLANMRSNCLKTAPKFDRKIFAKCLLDELCKIVRKYEAKPKSIFFGKGP